MSQTTSSTMSSHMQTELLSTSALRPLFSKSGIFRALINQSNIDGAPSQVRKIRKLSTGTVAAADTEGAQITTFDTVSVGSAISLTPTGYYSAVQLTIESLQRVMPGATYDACIAAVMSGDPRVLPLVQAAVDQINDNIQRKLETLALAQLASASETAGTTNTALAFSYLLAGLANVLDNNLANEQLCFVLEEKGLADLRSALISGSGASLSAIWGNSAADVSLFNMLPDVSRNGFRGSFLGMPVYAADKNLMTTANAGVDRVGAVMAIGQGPAETGMRGALEICYGHDLKLGFDYRPDYNVLNIFGRVRAVVGEHTDEHYSQIIYKKD
jgi:hypothetical protein